MSSLVWDLGFDFNLSPNPNNEDLPDLANALVALGTPAALANPLLLKPQDTIEFNLFNITPGVSTTGFSIQGGIFTFRNTLAPAGSPYPFDSSVAVQVGSAPSQQIQPAFGEGIATLTFPALNIAPVVSPSLAFPNSPFPRWQLVANGLPLSGSGVFDVTFQIIVQGPNDPSQTRTFSVDPQMIIGGAG